MKKDPKQKKRLSSGVRPIYNPYRGNLHYQSSSACSPFLRFSRIWCCRYCAGKFLKETDVC